MDQSAIDLSHALDNVARAVAEWTVARHAQRDRDGLARYGPESHKSWALAVQSHVAYLAQSVAMRRPALFDAMMQWQADAYRARGTDVSDLRTCLECLAETVRSELPAWASPALAHVDAALVSLAGGPVAKSSPRTELPALARRYLEAILDLRCDEAIRLVTDEAKSGTTQQALCAQVLCPAMAEIGRLWHNGSITVAEEHLASSTTTQTLGALRAARAGAGTSSPLYAVAAALAGDYHDLGLRAVAEILQMNGWRVDYVGVNTPADELVGQIEKSKPRLLVLSVGTSLQLRSAGEFITRMRAALGDTAPRVLVGGSPFSFVADLWQELGADGCAHTLDVLDPVARSLVA